MGAGFWQEGKSSPPSPSPVSLEFPVFPFASQHVTRMPITDISTMLLDFSVSGNTETCLFFFLSFKLLSLWYSVIAMENWKWHQFFKWCAFEFPRYLAKFRFMPSRPCLWNLSVCPRHKLQGNAHSANQTTSSNNQILILAYSQCQCEYWFETNKDYVLQFSMPALHNGYDL